MQFGTAALILVLLGGMSSPGDAPVEAGDSISYGCYGGFTGGGGGVTVSRDGTIVRWSKPTYRDPVERTQTQNREGAMRLFALLEELDFEGIDFNHPHYNKHCSLTLEASGSEHTVSWGHGGFPVPPKIQRIVDELEQLGAIPTK